MDFFGGREGLDVNRKRWESTLQAGAVQYSLRSVSVCSCAGRYQNIAAYLWKEFWGRCSGASRRQDSEPRGCQTSCCGAADVPVGGPILVTGAETGLLDVTAETCHQRH